MALTLAKTYAGFKARRCRRRAQAAAEELAGYETRFVSIEGQALSYRERDHSNQWRDHAIKDRIAGVEARIAGIEGKIPVLLWAVGVNAAATMAILGILLRHG
jgi:hypothetical protein